MFARHGLVALSLLASLPSMAAAQGFEYSPGTGRYRITQTTKVAQDAMGQKMDFETTSNQLVTVTIARASKDTLALTAVVDSISSVGPMGPMPELQRLIGVKADAKLSPSGTLYSVSTKDSAIAGAANLADGTGRFLPRVRRPLAKGTTWADTTTGKVKQGGIDIDRKTVSWFSVVGDTTVGGEKSWKVARDDTTSMSGTGIAQGQALTMEGTSVGKGAMFLSPKGTFVGAEGGEQSTIKLVLSANGMEINIVQSASTKVEKVK